MRGRPLHAWPELDRERLHLSGGDAGVARLGRGAAAGALSGCLSGARGVGGLGRADIRRPCEGGGGGGQPRRKAECGPCLRRGDAVLHPRFRRTMDAERMRSEEHTSELQSLMRISYAVFCLKKKNIKHINTT